MPNKVQYNSMQQSNNSKDNRYQYRSNRSSVQPTHNGNSQYSNDNIYYQRPVSPASPPSPSSMQYSAYFINRLDLENYTEYTLKQTVDSALSTIKTKGLKVKLSFPDDGLIIDNSIDPNQSWMFKASELLYFWRDPFYTNIIVAVTSNRTRLNAIGPYSASIFRIRGDGSVQMFFQRAQEFFLQLSTPAALNNNSKVLVEKSTTVDNFVSTDNEKNQKRKSKHHTMTNKQTPSKSGRSLQPTPVHHGTRREYDPSRSNGKKRNSIFNLYTNRATSETTLFNDARQRNSKGRHKKHEHDNKITSISVHLSGEHVAELMRELKELRNEIASLKLESRFTPVRSTSTSPMNLAPENKIHAASLSTSLPTLTTQLVIDTERPNGLTLINHRQQLNEYSITSKRKNEQSNALVNKRTSSSSSNNTESDKEDTMLVNFSEANESLDGITSSYTQEDYQSTQLPIRPRPIKTYPNGFTHLTGSTSNIMLTNNQGILNSIEEDSSSIVITVPKEKETTRVLSINGSSSSSILMDTDSSLSLKTGEVVSFLSSFENNIASPDHTYENIPPSSRIDTNKGTYYDLTLDENDQQSVKPDIYVNVPPARDYESAELQKRPTLPNPQESRQPNSSSLSREESRSQTPELTTNPSSRSQSVLFANRLTNPVFSVDRQLLANTIANQFDLHLNSPYLQKLIDNQHLFVSQKRTYANMIWQMTPEEENALRSSPVKTIPNVINTTKFSSNSSRAKSILKHNKRRSISRKQRITWDSTVE